jgi:signal transduction histidine kinase
MLKVKPTMLQLDVAHDLRNVLTVIIGNCELAANSPQQKHISRIRGAAIRGAALLESSNSADAKVDFSQPVNLNTIALEVGELMRSALVRSDKVVLNLDLLPEVPVVSGSSLWMFLSVLNLCLNARDAMIEKGGALQITTRAEGGFVVLAVSDAGKGMTENRLQTLWTPKVTADQKHGHGLQIVRVTMDRMNGKIDVQSKPGVGTTFTISLPAMAL